MHTRAVSKRADKRDLTYVCNFRGLQCHVHGVHGIVQRRAVLVRVLYKLTMDIMYR